MFRATKQHVTGTYHGKQKHGMINICFWILDNQGDRPADDVKFSACWEATQPLKLLFLC